MGFRSYRYGCDLSEVCMMGNLIFDALYALIFVGAFCLLLACGEWLFNLAYTHIPAFTKWWDKYCESLPDWDEDEECDVYVR